MIEHSPLIGLVLVLVTVLGATITRATIAEQADIAVLELVIQDRVDLNVRSCVHIAAAYAGCVESLPAKPFLLNGRQTKMECVVSESEGDGHVVCCKVYDGKHEVAAFSILKTDEECYIFDYRRFYAGPAQKPRHHGG